MKQKYNCESVMCLREKIGDYALRLFAKGLYERNEIGGIAETGTEINAITCKFATCEHAERRKNLRVATFDNSNNGTR